MQFYRTAAPTALGTVKGKLQFYRNAVPTALGTVKGKLQLGHGYRVNSHPTGSAGATVIPAKGESVNFSGPVVYKVASLPGIVNRNTVEVSTPGSGLAFSKLPLNYIQFPFD